MPSQWDSEVVSRVAGSKPHVALSQILFRLKAFVTGQTIRNDDDALATVSLQTCYWEIISLSSKAFEFGLDLIFAARLVFCLKEKCKSWSMLSRMLLKLSPLSSIFQNTFTNWSKNMNIETFFSSLEYFHLSWIINRRKLFTSYLRIA